MMNINLPDLTMPPPDRHVINRETSLSKAIATRKQVLTSIEKGTANFQAGAKHLLFQCLEEILAEPGKVQASYWCLNTADEIEQDLNVQAQSRFKRKLAAERKAR